MIKFQIGFEIALFSELEHFNGIALMKKKCFNVIFVVL